MFHKLGRFILVRSKESAEVVAFTSFRFEEEEEFGVVYWLVDDHLYDSPNLENNNNLTATSFMFPLRSTDADSAESLRRCCSTSVAKGASIRSC